MAAELDVDRFLKRLSKLHSHFLKHKYVIWAFLYETGCIEMKIPALDSKCVRCAGVDLFSLRTAAHWLLCRGAALKTLSPELRVLFDSFGILLNPIIRFLFYFLSHCIARRSGTLPMS
jgi:hypothetical protein